MSILTIDIGFYDVVLRSDPETVHRVELSPRTLLLLERRWPGRKTDFTDSMPRWEGLLYAMWVGMGEIGDFEVFTCEVKSITVSEVESADPTRQTVTGD